MKVTRRTKHLLRLHDLLFVVLLLGIVGMLGWLSTRYVYEADWTVNARNTLTAASVILLAEMPGEITVTAYARDIPLLRKRIVELVGRYQRHKPDVRLDFVNPDQEPQRVRELDITMDGEMVIEYAGRSERLQDVTESGITNALQRVARGAERRLVFTSGHGERDPHGAGSHDYANWVSYLQARGVRAEQANLLQDAALAVDNTVLVIASPQVALLPDELLRIETYVEAGGNLLWLIDPGHPAGFEPLARRFGLRLEAGVVVDPNISQVGMMLFGTDDPRVALVADYPDHEITRNFDLNTLFPIAGAVSIADGGEWRVTGLLRTLSNTWLERGEISGTVVYDEDEDAPGPLVLGAALTREVAPLGSAAEHGETATQRIVVIADSDFLANGFLGLGGNLQLGLNIVNWLSGDDRLIDIPARTAPDLSLQLSRFAMGAIGFGFLLVLPALLIASGVLIWFRRGRR